MKNPQTTIAPTFLTHMYENCFSLVIIKYKRHCGSRANLVVCLPRLKQYSCRPYITISPHSVTLSDLTPFSLTYVAI